MRKFITSSLLAVFFLSFGACSDNSANDATKKSPAEAMLKYMEYVQKGDYKAFVDGVNPVCSALQAGFARDSNYYEHMIELNKKEFEARGGVKKYIVHSTEYTTSGDSAILQATVTFGNDSTADSEQQMSKYNGVWYMDVW